MPPVKPLSNADKAKQMMLGDLREKAVRQNAIRGGQLGFVKAYTRSDGTVVRGYNKARALAWAAGTTLGRATAVAKRGAEIAVDQTAKGLKRDEVGRKVFGDVVAKSGKLMQEGSAREAKVKRQLGKWVKRVTTKDATPGSGITRKVRRKRR